MRQADAMSADGVWAPGEGIVVREILHGQPWYAWTATVVEDRADRLVLHVPEGAPWAFTTHPFGPPPRQGQGVAWQGSGILIEMRPGDPFSLVHFWRGPAGAFSHWYVNFQRPFARTPIGIDTCDMELDIVVFPDGRWELKDDELLDVRVQERRFGAREARTVRAQAEVVAAALDAGRHWWDASWRAWSPDPSWTVPPPPDADWASGPTELL